MWMGYNSHHVEEKNLDLLVVVQSACHTELFHLDVM